MARSTGKKHAEINLDIWGDDDWMDLTPPAQHLYFVLWTSPELSYCGCGPWHPGKIAAKARGWTAAAVEAAAVELSRELFLIVDTDTEEFDLRSWIKHDGIWRKPNMAVSMANARANLASRILRGVVVHEVSKIKNRNIAEATKENPVSTSWQRDEVKNLLSQKPIDPAELPVFTPSLTPALTPALTPGATPRSMVNGGVWVNPPSDPPSTPTPAPLLQLHTPEGYVTGVRHQSAESPTPFPNRCPDHAFDPKPPKCGACCEVRKADEALQRALRESAEAMRKAFWREVENCTDCGPKGQIDVGNGTGKCPHHDWSLIDA